MMCCLIVNTILVVLYDLISFITSRKRKKEIIRHLVKVKLEKIFILIQITDY